MPRNETKAGKASREKCWLPPFSSLYVEDPFDSVHIQKPLQPSSPAPLSLPPADRRIFTISPRSCIFFPQWAANVFPREIHWQGNCTKAAEQGQPAEQPTRWRSTERANTRVRFVERSCTLQLKSNICLRVWVPARAGNWKL